MIQIKLRLFAVGDLLSIDIDKYTFGPAKHFQS